MSEQLQPRHVNIEISKYVHGYRQGEYKLPVWQRQECWLPTYRKSLVESIMIGIDLPKIYIGEVLPLGKVIIDGGHRSRAINSYLNNEYPISVDEMMVYYTETRADTKNSRIMNSQEKEYIDTYKLTVCIYENLNESMARKIFNKLQNAVPMSVPDVVNSFESPLVDTLRDMLELEINDITVRDYFPMIKSLPKPDNNEDLYQMLSLATICWPAISGSNKMEALKWIEKGTTKNSKCFQYLLNFDNQFDGVTDEMKEEMQSFITTVFTTLNDKNIKLPTADFNTFCHCIKWVPNFDIDEFWSFFETVQEYNGEKGRAKKCNAKGQYAAANTLNIHADSVNESHNGKLSEWIGTRTSGGSSESGMKARLAIINIFCTAQVSTDESDEEDVENSNRTVLDNGEEIQTVSSI